MSEQICTYRTTTAAIMSLPAFKRGFEDARAGIPFDWRVGADDGSAWGYERGRLFAHIAPLDMPLWVGGKLNLRALILFDAAFERRLIT
jgi:hypothetical protein